MSRGSPLNLLRITLDPFGNFSPQQIKRIIGDLKLRFIPICKLPVGYIGETGTGCTQVLEVVVGAGVMPRKIEVSRSDSPMKDVSSSTMKLNVLVLELEVA